MRKHRSVSFTDENYQYVERMEGKNFTAKLNNMIHFCMTREKVLHEQERKLLESIESLDVEIKVKIQLLENLGELNSIIKKIKNIIE